MEEQIMELDKILAVLFSISGIAFTYWFFLMRKEESIKVVGNTVDILVDGGYRPEVISIPKNQTTKINFTRKDPSNCLEEVVLPDFKIKRYLPLNKTVTIEIRPQKTGEYRFECGMNMFHGKIKVI